MILVSQHTTCIAMSRTDDRDLNLSSGNGDEKTGLRSICKGLVTAQKWGEGKREREAE